MKIISKIFENIPFLIIEKSISKIIDIINKKDIKEMDTLDFLAVKHLLIEEAKLISNINYEIQKAYNEILKIKTIIYALMISNILIIVLLTITMIKN